MAKWGSCDFSQLKAFQKKLEKLEKEQDEFLSSCAKELAARLLAKVIKRTPVQTGVLRRGWTCKTEEEAFDGGEKAPRAYVKSLQVKKTGNTYEITVFNPIHYASYVEYGHRTRGGKGWVNGQLMLTVSEMELREQAAGILERKLKKRWEECFRD